MLSTGLHLTSESTGPSAQRLVVHWAPIFAAEPRSMPSPTSRRKKSPARAGAHTGQAARLGLGGNKLLAA